MTSALLGLNFILDFDLQSRESCGHELYPSKGLRSKVEMWSVVPRVRTVVVDYSFNAMFTVECNSLALQMIVKQTLYKMCGFSIIRPHCYA